MKKIIVLGIILTFLLAGKPIWAQTNKFGIHILDPQEVYKAAELVNSNGGDWGFVTIVIRDDEQNHQRWQTFFDDCRQLHLVPIVRLATHLETDFWVRPTSDNLAYWAKFLNELNWPVKKRYVVIFNEPNHQKEWGDQLEPADYAQILSQAITIFKNQNSEFQILNAGFDLAAGNTKQTMAALDFWQAMNQAVPGIFNQLDGWASHSYPNHGFMGRPENEGQTSIRGYQWELVALKNHFGLTKNLPIFITETGWPQKSAGNSRYYSPEQVSEFIKQSYLQVWLPDENVTAITPFVLFYPQAPFANFSWLTATKEATLQFSQVKGVQKTAWWPEQTFSFEIEKVEKPDFLLTESEFQGQILLKNTGQSIWGEKESLAFASQTQNQNLQVNSLNLPKDQQVLPGQTAIFDFTLQTGTVSGEFTYQWQNLVYFPLKIIPKTILTQAQYTLWQKLKFFVERLGF